MISLLLMVSVLMGPADNKAFMQAYRKARKLEQCQGLLKRFPQEFSSYECIWRAARRELRFDEAERMLEKMLAKKPDDHRARFFLGKVKAERYKPDAEPIMRQALKGLEAASDTEGSFWGNIGMHYDLRTQGRMDEAETQLEAARRVAERAGDELLLDEVRMYSAWLAFHRAEYEQAWILFKRLEYDDPRGIRRCFRADVYDGLANTASRQGKYKTALEYYQKELELIRRFVVPSWEAGILYSIAEVAPLVRTPRRFTPTEILWFDREALDVSIKAGDRAAEGRARLLLGQNPALAEAKRLYELKQALKILEETEDAEGTLSALRALARALLDAHPEKGEEAFVLVDRAIDLARLQDKPEELARGWIARAEMRWGTGPPQQAIEETFSALEAIERIRTLQHDQQISARVFGRFASAYRRFSGHLLARSELDLAFRITERMRAQVLLSALQISDRQAADNKDTQKDRLRKQISRLQKMLMDPGISREQRNQTLKQLERSEIDLIAMQDRIGRLRTELPRLSDLRKALAEDQALLFYQLDSRHAREFRGTFNEKDKSKGSWLLVVTRDRARAYPLEDREELEPAVQIFLGLIGRRDGSENQSAAVLHSKLLGPAGELLASIKRLVIVADGPLHRLPFGALRPAPDAQPLAATHQLSVAPSGSIWLMWQKNDHHRPLFPAVALADPALPFTDESSRYRSAGIFRGGLQLGPLPHARKEARALVDSLGGDSRVWEGAQASEHRIKSLPLRSYAVLHLAAHAVVDDLHPHRSAVVLAAGSEEEDGLLQAPEIAELDMQGLVVLLSTCSSARGEVIEGEGVLSLSRAFFQAGALAVVGNLWPLRDDEAAGLISDFTDRLVDGESLGKALSNVKLDWIREKRPTAAWAGLILQGDADFIPFPKEPGNRTFFLAGLLALAVLLGFALLHRRR